jgi:hypothetical protein
MRITKEDFLRACKNLMDDISLCGSSFYIWNADGITRTNYWFNGMYFYKKVVGSFTTSVAVKITKEEYRGACNSTFQNI